MKPGGDGQIGFEHEGELGENTLATWASVGDKQPRLSRIKDALGGIDELPDLKSRSPHCALPASDGGVSVAIIEHFVWHESATESEKAQLDAANVEAACHGLVENVQIRDAVCAQAYLLEHKDVLACAPRRVDWYREMYLARDKERELREHRHRDCLAQDRGRGLILGQVSALWARNQWRVRRQVLQRPVVDAVQAVRLKKAKVAGMNDGYGLVFAGEVVERRNAATDVGNAYDSPMGGIKHRRLGVDA